MGVCHSKPVCLHNAHTVLRESEVAQQLPPIRQSGGIYLFRIYSWTGLVINKTAKLFVNGGSQAVRLPAEFRFDNSDEVFIRRDAVTGDVILSAQRTSKVWRDFLTLRDQADVSADFLSDRPLNEPLKPRASVKAR